MLIQASLYQVTLHTEIKRLFNINKVKLFYLLIYNSMHYNNVFL